MAHQKREDAGRGHERPEGKVVGHPFPAPSKKSLSLRSDVLFPSSEMAHQKREDAGRGHERPEGKVARPLEKKSLASFRCPVSLVRNGAPKARRRRSGS